MLIIGLMSGTSADGIDAALVEISGGPGGWDWTLLAFVCLPWSEAMRGAILAACLPTATVEQIVPLNMTLGEKFAEAARSVAETAGVPLSEIDCDRFARSDDSAPQRGKVNSGRGTLQIGEAAVIAARTGCIVVSDFRVADMALGGQGAPLVPFADYAFFASTTETRAVQNIGGIANVTYLPKNGTLADLASLSIPGREIC